LLLLKNSLLEHFTTRISIFGLFISHSTLFSALVKHCWKNVVHNFFFSDSLFSLIILIYVAITFSYIFYAFCWRSPDPPKEEDKVNKMAAMRTRGEILSTFQNFLLALPRPFKEGRQGKKKH
jgi:hypothetical protein